MRDLPTPKEWLVRDIVLALAIFFASGFIIYQLILLLPFINLDIGEGISYTCAIIIAIFLLNQKYPLDISFKLGPNVFYKYILPSLFACIIFNFPYHAWFGDVLPKQYILLVKFNSAERLLYLFDLCLLGPAVEELFFRGFIYRGLKSRLGILWSVLISTSIFHLVHLSPYYWPYIALSIIFTFIYEKTGTIWASIITHSLNNTFWIFLVYWGVQL